MNLSLERRKHLTLAATILGSSVAFIDATVVIVAMPTIERDFDIGLAGEQWIFLAYSLTLASLYLVGGATGDRVGRRKTFTWGVVAFAAASALAGAAPNAAVLILARALQGVGGAFLTTNSLALLRATYEDQAGRAIGLWTAWTSVATVAGPPAGGALVEWASWRWIFFLNLPLAVATIVLARLGTCDERGQLRAGHLDLPGSALAAVGFGSLTYGMVEGADQSFGDVWWAFAVAAAALGSFVVVERRAKEPMLPFELFRRRNFAAANAETFLVYAGLYGVFVYFTLFVQFLGYTPFEAGLLNIPSTVVMVALAARFGTLADRYGPRWFLFGGPVVMALGAILLATLGAKGDLWTRGIPGLIVFSVGVSAMVAPITATALKSAPPEYSGIASGVNSTVSRLGSLIAVALIGLVIALVFHSHVDAPNAVPIGKNQRGAELRDASRDAYRAGMGLAAFLLFAGAAVGGIAISNREARGEQPGPVSEQAPAPAES